MRYVIGFLKFWQKFLIGDDLWGALIAIAGFAGTWALVRAGVVAWWLLPVVVIVSTAFSVWRKVRAELAAVHEAAPEPAPERSPLRLDVKGPAAKREPDPAASSPLPPPARDDQAA